MNVAYHLHKQQKNPAVITSIGIDEKEKSLSIFFQIMEFVPIFSRWIMIMKQEKYMQSQTNTMK